ncbi:MAG: flavin reductase family protein [Actinomycetota bacterium]|nr:flavin reductase family protein [Actinomycetota bacterium]
MPDTERRELSPSELPARQFAGLLKGVVVPRPIAWVSTTSADGIDNLAPHSFFTFASENPPILQFTSIGHKDSLRNATETGEFVINLADHANFDRVNRSGTDFPDDVDEFAVLAIRREKSALVTPPRVADSPVAIECRTLRTVEFGHSVVVFGEVLHLAIAESVMVDDYPDIGRLRPLARLGLNQWGEVGEIHYRARIRFEDLPDQSR